MKTRISLVAGLALLLPVLAWAQGAGLYIVAPGTARATCPAILGPVTNQSWCFDAANGAVKYWNGVSYVAITGGGGGGVTSLNALTGALNLVGTANQVVIATPSSTNLVLGTPQDIGPTSSPTFNAPTTTNLTVRGAPGITFQPTANQPATLGALVQQATTTSANRVFAGAFGLTNMGAGDDKVALYAGLTASSGGANVWSLNTVLTQEAGSGSYTAQGYELDFNNLNADRGTADGAAGLAAPAAYGLSITGVGPYSNTGAILISGPGTRQWNRGIVVANDAIASGTGSTFQDFTRGKASIDLRGAPTFGIYQEAVAPRNYFAGTVEMQGNYLKLFPTLGAAHSINLLAGAIGGGADVLFTFPGSLGTNGQCLVTNGAGVTSWSSSCSGGGGGSGISSLNGLTATIQTVNNDTNVGWSSTGSTHTFTWSGTLAVSRGGTGSATLANNGVLMGQGTSAVKTSSAGATNSVFAVDANGGEPYFSTVPSVNGITTVAQPAVNVLSYGVSTGQTGEVRFYELASNGTNYVGLKAPDSIASASQTVWKLPNADGTSGQCLQTDGAGALSFGSCATGSVTGTGAAGRAVYWTGASSLAGSANFLWDNTNVGLTVSASTTGANTIALRVSGASAPVARFEYVTDLTSAANNAFQIVTRTTGQMADGFGSRFAFNVRDADGVDNALARFAATRSGADNTGAFAIQTAIGGAVADRITIDGSGNIGLGPTAAVSLATSGAMSAGATLTLTNGAFGGMLRFSNPTPGTGYTTLRGGATGSTSPEWFLPSSQGSSGQVLTNVGFGITQWQTPGTSFLSSAGQIITRASTTTSVAANFKLNAQAYNATGNGTTDDTAALQSMFNAVDTSVGGSIFIPCGTYKVSATLTIKVGTAFQPSVDIEGASRECVKIKASGTYGPVLKQDDITTYKNINIRGLTIDGSSTATGGLQVNCFYCTLQDLTFLNVNGDAMYFSSPTGGNIASVRQVRVEANYETNSRGMYVLGDWVHLQDITVSKTNLGGLTVGTLTGPIKPFNTAVLNFHCYRVKQPCITATATYGLDIKNMIDEMEPGNETQSGSHVSGFYNPSTNPDNPGHIYTWNMGAEPAAGSTYKLIRDDAQTVMMFSAGRAATTPITLGIKDTSVGPSNVKAWGAASDGVYVLGSMTSGSATFTGSGTNFQSTDVGKSIIVSGAGASSKPLVATISSRASTTSIGLSVSAGTTVSLADTFYGTNDATAIEAALTSNNSAFLPAGTLWVTSSGYALAAGANLVGENPLLVWIAPMSGGSLAYLDTGIRSKLSNVTVKDASLLGPNNRGNIGIAYNWSEGTNLAQFSNTQVIDIVKGGNPANAPGDNNTAISVTHRGLGSGDNYYAQTYPGGGTTDYNTALYRGDLYVTHTDGANVFHGVLWDVASNNALGLLLKDNRATTTTPVIKVQSNSLGDTFAVLQNGTIQVTGSSGVTATKTAGSCTFTIKGGIITNVTGC